MGITKKDANARYDTLKEQLERGDISKEAFKASSKRIYNMYHSDANKATRNAPKAAPKKNTVTKANPVAKEQPAQQTKPKQSPQANKGKDGKPTGTHGKSLPSNPKLKTQPKTKPTKHKGGQRAKVNRKATKKTLQGIKKTVSKVTSGFFNKEGDKKTVSGSQYIFQKGRWRKYTV